MPLISVVSAKGGQGKSTLSYAIALASGGGILTNEKHSSVESIVGQSAKIDSETDLPEIHPSITVIFDGKAGIHERVVRQAIEQADHILIPIRPEGPEEIKRLVWAIQEVEAMVQRPRIAVVVMQTRRSRYESIASKLQSRWPYPVFWFPNSVHFQDLGNEQLNGETLHEKFHQGGLKGYQLREAIPQFEALMAHLGLTIQQ